MKFSVSSYSFSQYFRKGILEQKDAVCKAKGLGFDAVEFTDLQPTGNLSAEEYAKEIREECEKNKLPVSSYSVGADFLKSDVRETVEALKKKVDIAHILGAPFLRHDVMYQFPHERGGWRAAVLKVSNAIREVSEYAQSKGIKTMVENHGFVMQDADRVEYLINEVNHPNFGWLCDMGNFLCADENPEICCGKAAPYVFYVHAKDFIVKDGKGADPGEGFFQSRGGNYLRGTIIGHGVVPVMQCLRVLKNNGFDGYVSVEFEGIEDCMLGIRIGLDNLKKYLSSIENK